ncbi:cytochrome b5 domain-containing protein 1 [Anopheles nili]|uniref:cytochrome b5 domain-containing protein 1 n=1 Tax=Anopheles nili TaxID=185578 RepID=UPI00237BFF0F|nr:cytochrome b5 domain-containing protein 1 [Anopheles nili]
MCCETEPKPNKFYLPDEVVIHNEQSSAWVSIHGTVIDITPMFGPPERKAPLKKTLQWLLALAGQDLSAFFYQNMSPVEWTNRLGEQVPELVPCLERNPATGLPWWRDPTLIIGRITFHPCPVRIINTLTFHTTEMTVCYEDTIADVREKYLRYNDNACQYEWRKDLQEGTEKGKLQLDKTLTENGYLVSLQNPIPVIWIFYILPPGLTDAESDLMADDISDSHSGKCDPPTERPADFSDHSFTSISPVVSGKQRGSTAAATNGVGVVREMVEAMEKITI